MLRFACVALVVCASLASVPPVAGDRADTGAAATPHHGPHVVAVFPDPVADGDTGEYVVVDPADGSNLSLSDGETRVSVPPDGPVALSATPNATRNLVDVPVAAADLWLGNGGEQLVLRRNGTAVDRVAYETTEEGERLNATTGRWTPRGLTPREPVATGSATATAFVLPDAPGVPLETLRGADRRILLAGYTFASARVADALLSAVDRGVRVRVLLDGGPIGGMTTRQREQLDRLAAGGVDVRLLDGPHARFSYHHPKYAVADGEALVLTENWKPAGTGGRSSRGWGVRIDSSRTADALASVFEHDAEGPDAIRWRDRRQNATFVEADPASGSYDAAFEPSSVDVERVRVLTAPGNAGGGMRRAIAAANDSVDVISPRLDPSGPYFESLVAAAERGVEVRILLSNAWYDRESNRALVDRVEQLRDRGLPIEARIARPSGRFEKVHAKGAVIDGRTVLLGSLNWNRHSARENREVVVALYGDEPASYYGRTFEADWAAAAGGGAGAVADWRVHATLAAGGLAAVVLAGFVLRQTVEFDIGLETE
ncbi:phosphatidylserine synthase [Halobellus sp. MBLA0160]|uniref:Phosphatidylserine synthase n=1 Tax=Halobellus ruber TaxID=2761102 RepID=A0A7J9SME7_9EURY|nr:phosphatidylserine synthase [Halobellus ruber]